MPIQKIKLSQIHDNPYNPRTYYNRDKIAELASSIEQVGLIEVPQARKVNSHFEIAYGGYRRRAFEALSKKNAKKWDEMPLEIVDLTDEQMALFALEENLKRQDMTPLDTANAIVKYFEVFPDTTEEELAKKLTMTQGNISNMRRVVKLPKEILDKVNDGKINFTMARELLVLQGLAAGSKSEWRGGKNTNIAIDDKELMLEAVREVTGQYGNCTVNGLKKAIFNIAQRHFKRVDAGANDYYYGEKTLFDVKTIGCLKCPKMFKAAETLNQNAHFCTDAKCWEKNQEEHKKKAAEEAKRKMTADLAARVIKDVKEAPKNISQEIPAVDNAEKKLTAAEIKTLEKAQQSELTKAEADEKEQRQRRLRNLGELPDDYPCKTCLNLVTCDGTGVHAGVGDKLTCENRKPDTTDPAKLTKKAAVNIPPELLNKITEKAGTRGEILDVRTLHYGTYSTELTQGHVLLDNILDQMNDPEECTERCTKGFHYGFDSGRIGNTHFICTTPKCCSRKKAEFTRAKNARGMLKKKTEVAAIKQAVSQTQLIGIKELHCLFLIAINRAQQGYYGVNNSTAAWLIKNLDITVPKQDYMKIEDYLKLVMPAIKKLSEKELAGLYLRMNLESIQYSGEIMHYKINTTEALNLIGVRVNIPKEAQDPEKKSRKTPQPQDTDSEEEEGEE